MTEVKNIRPRGGWGPWLGEQRIYLLLLAVFVVMAALAPNFLTSINQTAILRGTALSVAPAVGFTIVMICRQLDLSIGSVVSLGGMLCIGLQPSLGWAGAVAVAVAAGLGVGLANGLLVAWGKVDSFIVTLGSMIVVQGLVYLYARGGTLNVGVFGFGEWLETPVLPLLTPRVLMALALAAVFAWFMRSTPAGRAFYLIGGSPSAAYHAAVPVARQVCAAFVISGGLSALGGALFAASISTAMPTMGVPTLMEVVAAVIIGGTAMNGGRGSVLRSVVALWTLTMLYNGLENLGAGWEARKMTAGAVLGLVILYEAVLERGARRRRGQRRALLDEAAAAPVDAGPATGHADDSFNQRTTTDADPETLMHTKDHTALTIVCVTAMACVAMVVTATLFLSHQRSADRPAATWPPAAAASAPAVSAPHAASALAEPAADLDAVVAGLRSSDGQALLLPAAHKAVPPRPADPAALPQDDAGHWYDQEYAGHHAEKLPMPAPPAGGARGKRVVYLKAVDHPYQTAFMNGMRQVADAAGVTVTAKTANNDINIQSQQVDQVINERPDLVVVSPVDAQACVPLFRKLHAAGIPVICSNLAIADQAHRYTLSWTGPDDWGQFRVLARRFAEKMNYTGGYAVVRHRPGSSPYLSRTWSMVTELKKIAPDMVCLEMQTTDLDSEKSKDVVGGWITRYGDQLKGIVSADDSGTQVGINEAVKNAGREDIVRVAAGNSKVGMDFLQSGGLEAITFQSAESDGATPMKVAVDWLEGKPVPALRYLPIAIIDAQNVADYQPAQW